MSLAKQLTQISEEICKMNECTEDNHQCDSYAYITADGEILDICASDYFQGSREPYAAIGLPWYGSQEKLKEEIADQTWEETEGN